MTSEILNDLSQKPELFDESRFYEKYREKITIEQLQDIQLSSLADLTVAIDSLQNHDQTFDESLNQIPQNLISLPYFNDEVIDQMAQFENGNLKNELILELREQFQLIIDTFEVFQHLDKEKFEEKAIQQLDLTLFGKRMKLLETIEFPHPFDLAVKSKIAKFDQVLVQQCKKVSQSLMTILTFRPPNVQEQFISNFLKYRITGTIYLKEKIFSISTTNNKILNINIDFMNSFPKKCLGFEKSKIIYDVPELRPIFIICSMKELQSQIITATLANLKEIDFDSFFSLKNDVIKSFDINQMKEEDVYIFDLLDFIQNVKKQYDKKSLLSEFTKKLQKKKQTFVPLDCAMTILQPFGTNNLDKILQIWTQGIVFDYNLFIVNLFT